MDQTEDQRLSFVVTLWREDDLGDTRSPGWRGHITHVPSGQRRYLKKLCDAVDFIASFVGSRSLGGAGSSRWLDQWWLRRGR
jgi:hypothetical protein